jgi:hypothetical protein
MARKIEVEIIGDASSYRRALGQAQGTTSKFGKAAKLALVGGAAAGLYALGKAAKIGWDEFNQGQKVAAQTNAVLKSTSGVANVTAKHVDDLAHSLMLKSGVDDEAIASGENLLLTFKGIRDEAGRGNDVFTQTTKIALDMATALGTDVTTAAMTLGKGLNDPITGMSRLTRVGVTFSQKQKDLITRLAETGRTMEAQRVILKELRQEFGGSARAAGQTLGGQINILRERFNNWAGDMVARVIPAIESFVGFISKVAAAKTMKARLRIIWTNVSAAARDLWSAIHDALFGTAGKPLKLNTGQILEIGPATPGLIADFKGMFASIPWDEVGRQIGSAIHITSEWVGDALTVASEWLDAHSAEIGELGAKLFATMVSTLTDPAFWAKNWKLALAIAAVVIPVGKLAKIGVVLGRLLMRPFVRFFGVAFEKLIVTSVEFFVRQFEKLPKLLQKAFEEIVKFGIKELGLFFAWLGKQLDKVNPWLRRAFKLAFAVAAFNAVKDAVSGLIGKVGDLIGWVKDAIGWVGHLLGMGGGSTGASIGSVAAAAAAASATGKQPPEGARGGHVARSGLAIIHRGENIIPARAVAAGGGGVQVIVLSGDRAAIEWLRSLDARSGRRSGRGVL